MHFEQDGHTITCAHVPKGTQKYNFDGFCFNLGDVALLPCQRCYVALREGILSSVVTEAMVDAIRRDKTLKHSVGQVIERAARNLE